MDQVLRAIGTEDHASAERSPSPQTPHPRPALHSSQSDPGATDAPSRGIKFPISKFPISDALKVLVYNFAPKAVTGQMRVWTLRHGRYRLRVGPDADRDDRMDSRTAERSLELARASAVPVTLPPKQVTVIELTRELRLDDERLLADLALSSAEVRLEGRTVHAAAHNIGSRAVESFDAALVDAAGTVRVRKTLGPLAAPLDLVPKRLPFAMGPLPAGAKGWSLVLDPDRRVPEIYEPNNRVRLRGD